METNQQLELANNLLKYTGSHIFLTGKAGTGKTTFLHNLRGKSPKRMIVVAPTGVAAINAKGVTIHSFFQLNFAPFVPDTKPSTEFFRFSKEKINIIRSLDLLVIDEISMVRADLLDAIDYVLRKIRHNQNPFGGVQLLMIGDLEQLAPVVKDDEWKLLNKHYETPFFFESQALKKTDFLCVELKIVYRQTDIEFLNILNQIREKKISDNLLQELNKRYQPNFNSDSEEGYITLTTHNALAQRINSDKLEKIKSKSFFYEANITGNFPEYSFPVDAELELKKGAQVMFVKNDTSFEKRYYNGKIAVITQIDENRIEVQSKDDDTPIVVDKAVWSNMKYTINPDTKDLLEEEEGSFEQYPLKTAWAITVHKSQGLTFDKAIIDANASFAHGQVYVALSRCRTLEGLVLSSPVSAKSIIRSGNIDAFVRQAKEKEPDEQQYNNLRRNYFEKLLFEQFSFAEIQNRLKSLQWHLNEYFKNLYPGLINQYAKAEESFKEEIMLISEKFAQQLQKILEKAENPEEDTVLQDRVQKAADYFIEKITLILCDLLENTYVETDNKEIKKRILDVLNLLQVAVRQKLKTLEVCRVKFSVSEYLNVKSKAAIEEVKLKFKKKEKEKEKPENEYVQKYPVSKDILHPELYEKHISWRFSLAQEQNVPPYFIITQKALIGISNYLPQNTAQLNKITGVGKITVQNYGEKILQIVRETAETHQYKVTEQIIVHQQPKQIEPDINTKEVSFRLFMQGKTIEEIANERMLVISTIEGHLMPYVQSGKILIEELVSFEKILNIQKALKDNPDTKLSEIKALLGDDYSYGEIRFVMADMKKAENFLNMDPHQPQPTHTSTSHLK